MAPFPSKGHLRMAPGDWERATGPSVTPSTFVLEGNNASVTSVTRPVVTEAGALGIQKPVYACAWQRPSSTEEMEQFGFLPQAVMQAAVLFHPSPYHCMYGLPAFGMGLQCFSNIKWGLM